MHKCKEPLFYLSYSLVAASFVACLAPSLSVCTNDVYFTCCLFSFVGLWFVPCLERCLIYDSAIWAQTAATDRAATTGGLFLQPLFHKAISIPEERVWTLVQILTERSTEAAECAVPMEIGPGGLDFSPFARMIYKHPDGEVHFVQLNVIVAQRQLPLRLAVAGFPRTPLDDGTCPRISEMQLVAVPAEMRRSYLVLTGGQVLFPFEDSPHITHDGVLLHGRCAPQRAIVYRVLQQAECFSPHGWAVGRGQARPPEWGEALASFPFSQMYTLPAVPVASARPTPPIPPWLLPQSRPTPIHEQSVRTSGDTSPQAVTVRPPAQLGVYALQALTDQNVIDGHDAPHARLSRELIARASTVRALACDIQRTFQNVRTRRQHCNVQPGANACWALASEMDTILTALRETQSATT